MLARILLWKESHRQSLVETENTTFNTLIVTIDSRSKTAGNEDTNICNLLGLDESLEDAVRLVLRKVLFRLLLNRDSIGFGQFREVAFDSFSPRRTSENTVDSNIRPASEFSESTSNRVHGSLTHTVVKELSEGTLASLTRHHQNPGERGVLLGFTLDVVAGTTLNHLGEPMAAQADRRHDVGFEVALPNFILGFEEGGYLEDTKVVDENI